MTTLARPCIYKDELFDQENKKKMYKKERNYKAKQKKQHGEKNRKKNVYIARRCLS